MNIASVKKFPAHLFASPVTRILSSKSNANIKTEFLISAFSNGKTTVLPIVPCHWRFQFSGAMIMHFNSGSFP
jgi:hypothetical protein